MNIKKTSRTFIVLCTVATLFLPLFLLGDAGFTAAARFEPKLDKYDLQKNTEKADYSWLHENFETGKTMQEQENLEDQATNTISFQTPIFQDNQTKEEEIITNLPKAPESEPESEQELLTKKIDGVLAGTIHASQEELTNSLSRLSQQAHDVYKTDPQRAQELLALQARYATALSSAQDEELQKQISSFTSTLSQQISTATQATDTMLVLANRLATSLENTPDSEAVFTQGLLNIEGAYNQALETAEQLSIQAANFSTAVDRVTIRTTFLAPEGDIIDFYTNFDQKIKTAYEQLVPDPLVNKKLLTIINDAETEGVNFTEKLYNYSKSRETREAQPDLNGSKSEYDAVWQFLEDPLVRTAFDVYMLNKDPLNRWLETMGNALKALGNQEADGLPVGLRAELEKAKQQTDIVKQATQVKEALDKYKEIYPALQSEQLYLLGRAASAITSLPGKEALTELQKSASGDTERQKEASKNKQALQDAATVTENLEAVTFTQATKSLDTTTQALIKALPKLQLSALKRFALWLKSFFSKAARNRLTSIRTAREALKNMSVEQFNALQRQLIAQIDTTDTISNTLLESIIQQLNQPTKEKSSLEALYVSLETNMQDLGRAYQSATKAFQGMTNTKIETSLQSIKDQLNTSA